MHIKLSNKFLLASVATLVLMILWLGLDTTLAQGPVLKGPQGGSPVYTFSYQGRLLYNGVPANGPYDFQFSVWDSDTGGNMLGSVVNYPSWPVTNGLFTANIAPDTLTSVFTGSPRWLQIEVRPSGSLGAYTTLSRQPITPAPYAWGLMPGATLTGTPTAWTGWVFRVDMTGTYPAASAVLANVATGSAVLGNSAGGNGLSGTSADGSAVIGSNTGANPGRGYGGYFTSANGVGLYGQSSAQRYYTNMWAPGVYGRSTNGVGVYGVSDSTDYWIPAIYGVSNNGIGVSGLSPANNGVGVSGWAGAPSGPNMGVSGGSGSTNGSGGHFVNVSTSSQVSQTGIWAGTYWGNIIEGHEVNSSGNSVNLRFRVTWDGNVYADGSYNCGLSSSCFNTGTGADVAERIDVSGRIGPGDVVEIDPGADGQYRLSSQPYSTLVAGVASTNPAMTMNNNDLTGADSSARTDDRPLLALVGQVPVKVTDENGPIQPGDLLVTSSTPGHAMKAGPNPPTGTVIGKAVQKMDGGSGVIKMLVMLR